MNFLKFEKVESVLVNLRIASFVPSFCIVFFLTYLLPDCWPIFEVTESVIEGSILFEYFKFLILGFGSWEIFLKKNESWNQSSLTRCKYFVLSLVIIRPFVFAVKAVVEVYTDKVFIGTILQIIAGVQMLVVMLYLLQLYHSVREEIHHTDPTSKFMLVKLNILFIIMENIIFGAISENDTPIGDPELRRQFAFFVLCQLFVTSLLSYIVFIPPNALGETTTLILPKQVEQTKPMTYKRLAWLVIAHQIDLHGNGVDNGNGSA